MEEKKMKKGKILKKIIITILVIFGLLFALILFLAISQNREEQILKQEIINYSNKNLVDDDFSITVKTSGDYAYVEEAVKRFYKELSDNAKTISSYLASDEFNTILSPEKLSLDRPNYTKSYSFLDIARKKINDSLSQIQKLTNQETVKNLLDKDKLEDSDYYYELYLNLMCTEQDLKNLEELRKETEIMTKNLNELIDKIYEILDFLKANDNIVVYGDNTVYFKSNATLIKYQELIEELNKIMDKIINSQGSKKNSNEI